MGESYLSSAMQSVYSEAPDDWTKYPIETIVRPQTRRKGIVKRVHDEVVVPVRVLSMPQIAL